MVLVEHLSKSFKGKEVISDVSFSVQPGEVFGLLGPNGAGKTTTIRIMATLLSPTSGTVEINGFSIRTHPKEVRKQIGVLTTDIGLYERFTGRENLAYFADLYGMSTSEKNERLQLVLELLQMESFADKPAGTYSTGMRQKLAIARSIIHDPAVIIFDEPTSGLDVLAAQTVITFIEQAKNAGKCVILSTHQMHDAERLCDRTIILHKGKVLAYDSIKQIKQNTQTEQLEDAFLKLVQA